MYKLETQKQVKINCPYREKISLGRGKHKCSYLKGIARTGSMA
jgi:hypothetical protein